MSTDFPTGKCSNGAGLFLKLLVMARASYFCVVDKFYSDGQCTLGGTFRTHQPLPQILGRQNKGANIE